VAVNYGRAGIFQSYQIWRFERSMKQQAHAYGPWWVEWAHHTLSAFMYKPVAKPKLERLQAAPPSTAGHASAPAVTAFPMGSVVGRLEIPKIKLDVMVLEGDDDDVLEKAAGHVPKTDFPGGAGNVVIAAHRDTFFRGLRNIHMDDEITLTTAQGVHKYQVGLVELVAPEDVQVLKALDHPTLTLITCFPFEFIGDAPKRFIVQAAEVRPAVITKPDHTLTGAQSTLASSSGLHSTSFTSNVRH
jgi:sortase A